MSAWTRDAWQVPSHVPSSAGYAPTPLGRVLIVITDDHLSGLYFDGHERTPALEGVLHVETATLALVRTQLAEYFAGICDTFELPLQTGGTSFQREVWAALVAIPPGITATYGEIAERIGRPQAPRAVGAANGRNPISIVIPCHRLVGSGGALTGYGWGIERKEWLIAHERSMSEARAGSAPTSGSDPGDRDLDGVPKARRSRT
jgi:methylated-DNA-[protein]-cysteine S-methyltransferase